MKNAVGGSTWGGGFFVNSATILLHEPFNFSQNILLPGAGGLPSGTGGTSVGANWHFTGFFLFQGTDGDGLPYWEEANQGCLAEEHDASLGVLFQTPNPGASFRTLPIALSGRVASSEITALGMSTDGGLSFVEISSPDSSLKWNTNWAPPGPGACDIIIRGINDFSGSTESRIRRISYQPDAPEAYITSPIHRSHVNGQLTITGKAAQGTAGFGAYTLEYITGEDPEATGAWTTIHSSPTEVTDDTLGTWNVLTLPEGPYVLRLRVDDGAGTESKTWVTVYVDHDTTTPSAPASVAIEGLVQPDLVANSDAIETNGQGDGDCYLEAAELIDEEGAVIKDVTYELTLHFSGAVRGTCYMPSSTTAEQVALRVRYRDFVGKHRPGNDIELPDRRERAARGGD